MPKKKMTKAWWQSPVLQVLALALIAVVVTALVLSPQKSVDPRSDASAIQPAPGLDLSLIWPNTTPITVGTGPDTITLPSGYQLLTVDNSLSLPLLKLVRPLTVPYATYPVFVTETTWNPSTIVRAYGWSSVPCNQSNFFLSVVRAVQDPNTLVWGYAGNQEIAMGSPNEMGSNPSMPEFCMPDPIRPGKYAFRLRGDGSSITGNNVLQAAGVIVFPANGASATLTLAKVTVNGNQSSWPPSALMCGESCSEQAGFRCDSGLVCKLNPGQLTKGVCVLPSCAHDNCTCSEPVKE